ncbi:MAG: hypothetical protein AABZ39_17815 [Spirochaetota bacterium]
MRLASLMICISIQWLCAAPSDILPFSRSELTEIESSFFADIDDGKLDDFTAYDAFLIASGLCERAEYTAYQKKIHAIRDKALADLGSSRGEDPYALGKKLLFWLYDNVLKTYQATATVAYTILDNGEYNCLSASILYCLLAADLGLPVYGVMVPDHAFCVLKDARGDKDIETTVKYGFDPGSKEIEKLRNETRYVYVPKNNYSKREEMSVLSLIANLYGNRISLLQHSTGDCEKDMPKYKKGYYIDPRSTFFRENIASCFHNLAIFAVQKNAFTAAMDIIRQGKVFDPKGDYRTLTLQVYQTQARTAAATNDFAGAIAKTKEAFREYPADPLMRQNVVYYYTTWGRRYSEKKDYQKALSIFEAGNRDVPDAVLERNIRAMYYNLAAAAYRAGDRRGASRICDTALTLFPADAELKKLKAASQQ